MTWVVLFVSGVMDMTRTLDLNADKYGFKSSYSTSSRMVLVCIFCFSWHQVTQTPNCTGIFEKHIQREAKNSTNPQRVHISESISKYSLF